MVSLAYLRKIGNKLLVINQTILCNEDDTLIDVLRNAGIAQLKGERVISLTIARMDDF
jgi:hypothetical protein